MFNVIPLAPGHAYGMFMELLTSYRSYANAHECFRNGRVLRGKCVPRDLKVNETNAEYLYVNSMRLKLNVRHWKTK